MGKDRVILFVDTLLSHLNKKGLLFEGWQQQRDVRRKVKGEIRIMLLSMFRDERSKIDELMESVFRALGEVT